MPGRGSLLLETKFTLLKLLDELNAEKYGSEAARVALICSDMHEITTNDYEWTYLTSRWRHVDFSLQLHMHKNSLLSNFHHLRDVILDNTEHYTSQQLTSGFETSSLTAKQANTGSYFRSEVSSSNGLCRSPL